ncbi:MAG: TetR/AcrR family transcriptional regulator [Rhodospirillales bacterium]
MARRGSHTITLSGLAQALCISAGTLRRHFADLDVLLAILLCRHLRQIARALGDIPRDAPDRPQKMRAAYLDYTRTMLGGYTQAHLLLVRDRQLLPDDLLSNVETIRHGLGDMLAHGHAEAALALLDTRSLDAPLIEAALTALVAAAEQRKPAPPAPKPTSAAATTPRRDRPIPSTPPWAPRDDLALLRGGPRLAPTNPGPAADPLLRVTELGRLG